MADSPVTTLTKNNSPDFNDIMYVGQDNGSNWYLDKKADFGTIQDHATSINTINKGGNYTIPISECDGRWISNKSTSGHTIYSLPEGKEGYQISFVIEANQWLEINPISTDSILPTGVTVNGNVYSQSIGSTIVLRGFEGGWLISSMYGTWDNLGSSSSSSEEIVAAIKTIMPDGGGDYTTLALWEDWADDQVSTDQWAECYDGVADMGIFTISGWTGTPSATEYPRIYAPLAERHNGTSGSAGAWIEDDSATTAILVQVDFTRIEGIRIVASAGFSNRSIKVYNADNAIIDSNLLDSTTSAGGIAIEVRQGIENTYTVTIRNNIIYGDAYGDGLYVYPHSTGLGTYTLNSFIYNNTIDNCSLHGIHLWEYAASGLPVHNTTCENNVVTNTATKDFEIIMTNGTITTNNNCSEDDTADDDGGSDHLISQTPGDLFVTEGSDHNLKTGSNAIDAGKTIGTFAIDALKVARPQGASWDIGALEKV
jgi:hypothetical protein